MANKEKKDDKKSWQGSEFGESYGYAISAGIMLCFVGYIGIIIGLIVIVATLFLIYREYKQHRTDSSR